VVLESPPTPLRLATTLAKYLAKRIRYAGRLLAALKPRNSAVTGSPHVSRLPPATRLFSRPTGALRRRLSTACAYRCRFGCPLIACTVQKAGWPAAPLRHYYREASASLTARANVWRTFKPASDSSPQKKQLPWVGDKIAAPIGPVCPAIAGFRDRVRLSTEAGIVRYRSESEIGKRFAPRRFRSAPRHSSRLLLFDETKSASITRLKTDCRYGKCESGANACAKGAPRQRQPNIFSDKRDRSDTCDSRGARISK
jgi:hypothetical protein